MKTSKFLCTYEMICLWYIYQRKPQKYRWIIVVKIKKQESTNIKFSLSSGSCTLTDGANDLYLSSGWIEISFLGLSILGKDLRLVACLCKYFLRDNNLLEIDLFLFWTLEWGKRIPSISNFWLSEAICIYF